MAAAASVMVLVGGVAVVALPLSGGGAQAAPKAPAVTKAGPVVAPASMWQAVKTSGTAHGAAAGTAKPIAKPAAKNASGHALQIDAPHGRVFSLDTSAMTKSLKVSPREFTPQASSEPLVLSIPDPVSGFQQFNIENAPIMADALAAQHPEIQTYSGVGITDPTATIRIAMTPVGFSASVRGVHGSWYVDTLYHLDTSQYISYYASDLVNTHGTFIEQEDAAFDEGTSEVAKASKITPGAVSDAASPSLSAGSVLRVYRLALVSDPTFAAYWGAANVTAAKVILMIRANQIYEEEFGYRMDLIANNDLLNFNTPASAYEPNGPCGVNACFTQAQLASCGSSTLTRNRLVVGQIIGAANYDIGHIAVGQNGGGIAGLGVVGGNSKAQGCTGIPQPDGDYYVTDYLTHEMGHEFGMNHPFNGNQYNCSSSNRNANTSYEPGSGSSIMAYAGICKQDDLQPHSDPYFSAISFQETQAYTSSALANLPEVQTGVLTHFGGGNEVQTVSWGPGYQLPSTIDHGVLSLNAANPSASSGVFPGAAEVGNLVTINVSVAHNLHVGDVVTLAGVPVAGYNGTWTITAVPFSTSFQFIDTNTGLAQTGGAGTVTPPYFGATESGTTVTLTTTTPHNLSAGATITVAGLNPTGYNGTFQITSVPTPTTLQYTAVTSGLASTGSGPGGTAGTISYSQPFQLGYNGTDTAVIGGTGLSYTTANIQAALTAIPALAGNVTVASASGTGFTVTFGGALANTDVSTLTIDNLSCGGCFASIDETNHGGVGDSYALTYGGGSPSATITNLSTSTNIVTALQGTSEVQTVSLSGFTTNGNSYQLSYNGQLSAVITRGTNNTTSGIATAIAATPGWIPGSTVTIGALTDNGFTVTFNALGDVPLLSVVGSGSVTGSAVETIKGVAGILPAGATATVATDGFGGAITSGIQVTFGGALAAAQPGSANVLPLAFTALTGTAIGSFNETEKGGPATGNGGTVSSTGNTPPTAVVGGPYTIPYQTPFALTGSSTDPDAGDAITYMWEQFDKGGAGTSGGTALITQPKVGGPLFREFGTALNSAVYDVHAYGSCAPGGNTNGENCALTSPTRVFPDMAQILADNTDAATGTCPETIPSAPVPLPQALVDCLSEFLPTPTYGPAMHFILTTRDGHPGAGGVTESGQVTVNLAGTTPFRVTSQSTPTALAGGLPTTVTWNVAGTNSAPVSTANMKILLSTDGGNTFPTTLAASVPNNGSATVTIPNVDAANARIEVAPADGNIYFDVNHAALSIVASPTISFTDPGTHTYGDSDFALVATASDGLTVTFTVGATDPCTVTGATVHITGAGVCTITAHQAGDATHPAPLDVTIPVTINKEGQTITFAQIADHAYGDAPFDVSAVSSSGLPVTFSSGASTACTLTGVTVTIVTPGSCTITASQVGDGNYLAAADVPNTFAINKEAQSINFAMPADHTFGDPDFDVSATATSGLTVSFAVLSGACTITGTTVHLTGGGSCTIEATQAGDTFWAAATPVDRTFTINKKSQTITFGTLSNHTFGDADITLTATASSGLAVTYTTTGPCSATGSTLQLTGGGTCFVTAHQVGNTSYLAASDVTQSFTIAKARQTITFGPISTKTFGAADFTVTATASSGLPVQFTVVSGSCEITGSLVHIIGAGSCIIAADQPGDSNYLAAKQIQRPFTINKGAQTITFNALPSVVYGSPDVNPGATASSGLAVSYTVTGPCTVLGSMIHATGVGTCHITASQAGNANWKAAASKTKTLAITKADTTTVLVVGSPTVHGGTVSLDATVSGPGGPVNTGTVQFLSSPTAVAGTATVVGGVAHFVLTLPASPGTLRLHAVYVPATNGNWAKSTSAVVVVTVT